MNEHTHIRSPKGNGCLPSWHPPTDEHCEIQQYIAYGGRFVLDENTATVRHDVTMSTMPALLTQPQFRSCRIDGDVLTLSTTSTDEHSATIDSTLVWTRLGSR